MGMMHFAGLVKFCGQALAWFGAWLLLMVLSLSLFYYQRPLWETEGMGVLVQPLCLLLLGLVFCHGISNGIARLGLRSIDTE